MPTWHKIFYWCLHSLVPSAQDYSPQSSQKLLGTQDLLSNSWTFLLVSKVDFQPSSAACVRLISKWAECLWFHGLSWWASNELKCATVREVLSCPQQLRSCKSHSASHQQKRERWTDDRTTNSKSSSCTVVLLLHSLFSWGLSWYLKFHHLLPLVVEEQKIFYTNKNVQLNSHLTL